MTIIKLTEHLERMPPERRALVRAIAAFEGWLVANCKSEQAEEATRLVDDILLAETERCCSVVLVNVCKGAQRDRAIRAMKRGPQ